MRRQSKSALAVAALLLGGLTQASVLPPATASPPAAKARQTARRHVNAGKNPHARHHISAWRPFLHPINPDSLNVYPSSAPGAASDGIDSMNRYPAVKPNSGGPP